MIDNVKKYLVKGRVILNKSISIYTIESTISKELTKIQNKYSKKVNIGSYPFFRLGKIGVSIVLRSSKKKELESCFLKIKKMIRKKNIKVFN